MLRECVVPKENVIQDGIRAINSGGHLGMLGASAISSGLSKAAFEECEKRLRLGISQFSSLRKCGGVCAWAIVDAQANRSFKDHENA